MIPCSIPSIFSISLSSLNTNTNRYYITINTHAANTVPIIMFILKSFEPSLIGAVVVSFMIACCTVVEVVVGSELKVMISMFNIAKSIYKDHFIISCSKILSIVVILQYPKMNTNGMIVLFRMRVIILSNVNLPLCLKGIYQIQKILPL